MRRTLNHLLLATLVACSGCGHKEHGTTAAAPLPASLLPDSYFAATAPVGARPVVDVRRDAKTGDTVIVTGRAGGKVDDFDTARASFLLSDAALKFCSEDGMDSCTTPWDACCESDADKAPKMVSVEFRDAKGVLHTPVRGFHGLDHMKTVTVTGKAEKDAAGNVTIVAQSIAIKP